MKLVLEQKNKFDIKQIQKYKELIDSHYEIKTHYKI